MTKIYDALVIIAIVIGIPFLVWFYFIDGIYLRPVVKFTQGVDPMNFKLEKTEYRRGEMVRGYTSVCKLRQATGHAQWNLVNDVIITYSANEERELPVGCYPWDQDGEATTTSDGVATRTPKLLLFDIKEVPKDIEKGEHYFTGQATYTLNGGRQRRIDFKSETFNII